MTNFPETRAALARTREIIRIIGPWEYLFLALRIDVVRDWFLRVYYCHHNARVLADMEWRLGCVLNMTTRGMSKPYYTLEAMRSEIEQFLLDEYNEAYAEGRKDMREEVADAARALLDCLSPGVILTIGGRVIDHTEINDAKQALDEALK